MRLYIVPDLLKAKVKDPGSRGGKYYFDRHGNIRYGKEPSKTKKVAKVGYPTKNPYPESHPLFQLFRMFVNVGKQLSIHTPKSLHDFLVSDYWPKLGIPESEFAGKWQDLINTATKDGNLNLHVDQSDAEMPAAHEPAAPVIPSPHAVEVKSKDKDATGEPLMERVYIEEDKLSSRQAKTRGVQDRKKAAQQNVIGTGEEHHQIHKLWNTLDLSNQVVVPAPKYKPKGLSLTLKNGKKIKLSAVQEEMALAFSRYMPERLPGGSLSKVWGAFVTGFKKDFTPVMGMDVDLESCNWRDFDKASAADKLAAKKAEKKPKGTGPMGMLTPKDYPRGFVYADGVAQPIGQLKLTAARIYMGGGTSRSAGDYIKDLGRWLPAITFQDTVINCTPGKEPKGYLAAGGKSVHLPDTQWILKQTTPLTGSETKATFDKKAPIMQASLKKRKEEGNQTIFREHKLELDKAVLAAVHSSDPVTQEIGFACVLMDTMYARVGQEGKDDTGVGIMAFTPSMFRRDGTYQFKGKDAVRWDTDPKVGSRTLSDGSTARFEPAVMASKDYDLRPIYDRMAKGKGPNDPLFKADENKVRDFIRATLPLPSRKGDKVAHLYRYYWATKLMWNHMAGREKQLLAMKKKLGASDSTYIAAVVKAAKVAAEFAGVKLGHTKTLATKENIKFSNAKKVQAAILRAKQKGEPLSKRDVAALQAKHAAAQPKAASGVGANTTRGSYIDHGVMLKYTWDKFGVDYRTAPEKKAMHGLGLEARLGIPVEKNRAKKVKKGLFSAFSKSFPLHIDGRTPMSYNPDNCGPCHTGYPSMWWYDEMLARLADPIYDASGLPWESPSGYVTKVPPRPNPFITPYPFRRSLHGGRAERAGKRAKDFDKKKLKTGAKREEEHTDDPHEAKQIAMDHLIEDPSYYAKLAKLEQNERIRKAIGTKQSEEMKGPKKAPPPTKSSGQTVDPKNGKKRYEYKGQTPDKGKPAKKEKGGASDQKTGQKPKGPPGSADQAQAEAPPPPPQINVQEAANALHITVGTLSAFAKHFKDVEQFTAYLKATVRPFLIKHNVGEDALRRLYEQLNPPQQSDQKPEQPPQNALGQ